jgi:hypothetical protein
MVGAGEANFHPSVQNAIADTAMAAVYRARRSTIAKRDSGEKSSAGGADSAADARDWAAGGEVGVNDALSVT